MQEACDSGIAFLTPEQLWRAIAQILNTTPNMTASEILEAACGSGFNNLTEPQLLAAIAVLLNTGDLTAGELLDAACENGLSNLSPEQLLVTIAQNTDCSGGRPSGDCVMAWTPDPTIINAFNVTAPSSATVISFASATEIGSITLGSGNAALITVSGPLVDTIAAVNLSNLPNLTTFSFPVLTAIDTFLASNLAVFPSSQFNNLYSGIISTSSISLSSLPGFTAVSIPSLTSAGSVSFSALSALTALNISGLATLTGDFSITTCPALLNYETPPGLSTIGGNVVLQGFNSPVDAKAIETVGANLNIGSNLAGCTSVNTDGLLTTGGNIDITNNAGWAAASFPDTTSVNGTVQIFGNTGLLTASFPSLTFAGGIIVRDNPDLTSVSFPVQAAGSNPCVIKDNALLASINMASIVGASEIEIRNLPALTSLSLAALDNLTSLVIKNCATLPSISLPVFTVCPAIDISDNPSVTSLNLSSFSTIQGTLTALQCTVLASVTWGPGFTIQDGSSVNFGECSLDQANVDAILAAGVAGGMTSGLIDLSAGANATPSATGLADAGTLAGNGVTVLTN